MRGVFKAVAALALIAILVAPCTYADDPSEPVDQGVRIRPPSGIAAQPDPPITFELLWFWLQIAIL